MRALIVEPMKPPYLKEIGTGLEDLQKEVGGYVEAVYPFDDPVAVICNEEGKIAGLPLNRSLRDENGKVYDVIAGTFLVVGLEEESFGALPRELVPKYTEFFRTPETFAFRDSKIVRVPAETETRNGVRLVIRRDDDPVPPGESGDRFGKLVCFDGLCGDGRDGYRDPEEFLLDRLAEHFGSGEAAQNFLDETDNEYLFPGTSPVPEEEREDAAVKELKKDHVILPVYRSGDDGETFVTTVGGAGEERIGWIYARKKDVVSRFGDWSGPSRREAERTLESEVMEWNDYLRGENYVYDLIDERTGEVLDGGFWTGDTESLRAFAWNGAPDLSAGTRTKGGKEI